jgi:hypothetical protein
MLAGRPKMVAEEGEFVMYPGIFPPIRDAEKVAPRMVFMDNPSEEEFKKLMTVTFREISLPNKYSGIGIVSWLKRAGAKWPASVLLKEKEIMNGSGLTMFLTPAAAFRQDPGSGNPVVSVMIAYLVSPTVMLFYSFLSKPRRARIHFRPILSAYRPLTWLLFNSFVFAGASVLATPGGHIGMDLHTYECAV